MTCLSPKQLRENVGEEEENQRKKLLLSNLSLIAQMEKCLYCFDSSQFPKHLIVAIGVKVKHSDYCPKEMLLSPYASKALSNPSLYSVFYIFSF